MNSYIHKIFVHHNHVKKHFELDISREEKEKYRNLIITGKNDTGKTTLLKAINKELFLYKTGIIPPNIYYNLNSKFKKEELEKLDYINPKVELIFGQESDFLEEDLLVIYIPTFRNIPIDISGKVKTLSLKQSLVNQNRQTEQIKQNNLKIAKIQQEIINLETFIRKDSKTIEGIKEKLKNFDDKTKNNR
ncbi:MAG: hypothetical protein AB8G86_26575 [Saprospiraceae bacterium]